MIIALIVYVVVYLIGTFILTIPHDTKFTTYKSRVQFTGLCMILWPVIAVMGIAYAFHDFDNEELSDEKRRCVRKRLEIIDPDSLSKWGFSGKGLKRDVSKYLKTHSMKDGLTLIKSKHVSVEQFMVWHDNIPTSNQPSMHWNTDSDSQEF